MASIINRPNRHRWVQFYDGEGKRQTIRLGQVTKKNAEEVCRRVEALIAAKTSGDSLDASTAGWVRNLEGKIRDRLAKLDLVEPKLRKIALGDFLDDYIEGRSDVGSGTLETYDKARRNLVGYFGRDRTIDTITKSDATKWRVYVATKSNAREKNRTTLADSTVRRRTGKAKQFFDAAIEAGYIETNPFSHLPSTVHANEARQHFVERETIEDCIAAAPDARWRLIIALARFGGLRCPSELTTLRWSDVDFAAGRITINAPKTKRHRSGGRRVCPMFPELRPYLEDFYELAEPGSVRLFPNVKTATNLRQRMEAIIERAGHVQWPKLFQNLRASRETELLALYPAKDVTAWLGNSVPVAMKHYAMARKETFEAAATKPSGRMPEASREPTTAATTEEEGEAKSEAIAKRKPKLRGSATNGAAKQRHKKTPEKPGSFPPNAAGVHQTPGPVMGVPGSELGPKTPGFAAVFNLCEAKAEAMAADAALRDLLQVWTALSDDAKRVIATVAKADAK